MIKLFHKILSIVFLAITLSGCGGHQKTFIALSPELKQQIGSTDVYLEECEQKISAETEKSNMGLESGSLLLMLADSAIESNRQRAIEKAIQDIQKELETYELRQKFSDIMAHELRTTHWLHVHNVSYMSKLDEKAVKRVLANASADAVLTGSFEYKLNQSLDAMTGTLYITLYPASPKIKNILGARDPLKKPILKFHITATEKLRHKGSEQDENVYMWVKDNGLHLKNALDNIINRIVIDLKRRLQNPDHIPK